MGKIKLIALLFLLVGCSAENTTETANFYIPQQLVGEYRVDGENFFLVLEEHKVMFNTTEGEEIQPDVVVTQGTQMATDEEYGLYVTLRTTDDMIIYIRSVAGNGVRLEYDDYYYDGNLEPDFVKYYYKL